KGSLLLFFINSLPAKISSLEVGQACSNPIVIKSIKNLKYFIIHYLSFYKRYGNKVKAKTGSAISQNIIMPPVVEKIKGTDYIRSFINLVTIVHQLPIHCV